MLWDASDRRGQAARNRRLGEGVADTIQLLKEGELMPQFNIILMRSHPFILERDFQLGFHVLQNLLYVNLGGTVWNAPSVLLRFPSVR